MPLKEFDPVFPNLCKRLRQTKAKERTGQAYLLVGDDIAFLERFANAWAQTAACTNPAQDGSPCGECPPCKLFQRNSYPECYQVRPVSKSRKITVGDMRDFEHILSLSPRPGFMKIGIIVEADRLGDEAQNAFLKTLEEPPQDTMLLLLTRNARMLLPTIKSRCQVISLLRNRQNYSEIGQTGLFKYLSLLYRRAGAANGLKAAAGISAILTKQKEAADDFMKKQKDPAWKNVDDPALLKQMDEEMKAKGAAEYVRMRDEVTGAIQAWFLQRLIIAGGAATALLPNPEMLENATCKPATQEEAAQDIKYAEEFARCLNSNVDEKIALDAMCLMITEKRMD